jgi:DNA-binding transcriptional regulator LsrR (DeoR family)
MAASPGSIARAPTDGQLRLITKVARMYHERGIRQTDIAESLHISQARVSRLLKRAAELGIVRTVVAVAPGVHTEIEEALEETYGLAEAVVVDVEGTDEEIIAGLGSAGATYLETTLTGGERIGISSWSQTLLAVVDRMRSFRIPGAESVVQLMGGFGSSSVQTQGNRLLSEFARLVGATATFVPAPALVGNKAMRESLLNDPAMESVAKEWARLTMALAGIGSLPPSPLLRASGNAADLADQDKLHAAGAVGDICQRFFDSAGTLVPSDLDD